MFSRRKPGPSARKPSHPSIERARKVATLLDSAVTIPVLNKKVGLDPLLGLIPGGGDLIAALIASYIVYVAVELRLPKPIIAKMTANLIADLLVSSVPLVGDVADVFWSANMMNLKMLEEAYEKYGLAVRVTEPNETFIDVHVEPAQTR